MKTSNSKIIRVKLYSVFEIKEIIYQYLASEVQFLNVENLGTYMEATYKICRIKKTKKNV